MQLSFTDLTPEPDPSSGPAPFTLLTCPPGGALDVLASAVERAKDGDLLAPVTVVVPSNVSGVMARRALGRGGGVLGVDMVTLGRVAELVAGPGLAGDGRRPVSTPVLELTVRRILDEEPGMFRAVAGHPATITALRELHQELRLADPAALDRLAATRRGREAVRVSRAVARLLRSRWYDEADLFHGAADLLENGEAGGLDRIVLHLPRRFTAAERRLVTALASRRHADVAVTAIVTGAEGPDRAVRTTLAELGLVVPTSDDGAVPRPRRVIATTDADDEVNVAVRNVVAAARGDVTGAPVPYERIAVLWPAHRPYARLVEHHLVADDVPWNGRGGTELAERIVPRLLLDLLALDRRGLGRSALFELLADVPARDADGTILPTARWERVARAAGVHDEADWASRLGALVDDDRWGEAARSLMAFVTRVREGLGDPRRRRSWRDWADWCDEQLTAWLGRATIGRLSDPEYRAWEALDGALDRLRGLDHVAEPIDRRGFRTVLESELGDLAVREGRIGTGVTVGSLGAAGGLDVDVAIVLGAADGVLPPAPRTDPLLSERERILAGLPGSDQRSDELYHEFAAVLGAADVVVTAPRGDLRANTGNQLSRWIRERVDLDEVEHIASATAGLEAVDFPPSLRERRLTDHLAAVRRHGLLVPSAGAGDTARASRRPVGAEVGPDDDPVLHRSLVVASARSASTLTEFDGDLSGIDVPRLGDAPVSPTRLEAWARCPHAYFVHYLLGVRPLDDPGRQLSINPLDAGSLHHDVLDAFHRRVIAGELPQPTASGWTAEHLAALREEFDAGCSRVERAGRTGRPATWAGRRVLMWRELVGWLERDGRRSRGRIVVASELRFPVPADDSDDGDGARPEVALELGGGRRLPLQGSIDRVDRAADGSLVVTDHKTGSSRDYRGLDATDPTRGGTRLQLPTYALAAAALVAGRPVDEVAIRSEYSFFSKGGFDRIGYELDDDVWGRVRAEVLRLVDGIESGWFPQNPARPGFRLWVDCEYCEPDHLGTAESWERWQAKRHDPRVARWFGDPDPDDTAPDDGGPR